MRLIALRGDSAHAVVREPLTVMFRRGSPSHRPHSGYRSLGLANLHLMTVAVVVKVWDGIVLAADSATTMRLQDGSSQVYNSANKVFQLHRQLPVGAMTWGLGSIGPASIATLAKDLRTRLMGQDKNRPDWQLDPDSYTVEEVARRLVEHFHAELYSQVFAGQQPGRLGLLVAGYSANETAAEAWLVELTDPGVTPAPQPAIRPDQTGWLAFAQPAANERLWLGMDRQTLQLLEANLTNEEFAKVMSILQSGNVQKAPVVGAMPLQDAIALAELMVNVTASFTYFVLGPNTVGGPTEVASMSRHEKFRWIARKHYYRQDLNPRETDHEC